MIRCCIALACALAASAAGAATPIYRCAGNTYSQTPCTGGRIIESSDPRTAAQRAEARRLAAREKELADALERERRQQAPTPARAAAMEAGGRPPAAAASSAAEPAAPKPRREGEAKPAPAVAGQGVLFIAPRPARP
jgi:hypothetical protein